MAQNSKIEWTNHTVNLCHGCTGVHEGCIHCYAADIAKKMGNDVWGNDKPRLEIKSAWNDFKRYQTMAKEMGQKQRVFVGSMMDIFEKPMPLINHHGEISIYKSTEILRQKFFREVVPASPDLEFLLLTKRPSNINKYIPESWKTNPPKNVMFGTSPVNQATYDTLVRQLKEVKGRRFLSIEPQLDEVDLSGLEGIDWVIQGGESGSNRRPFKLEWAIKMKEQCAQLDIPYFFKQIDKVKQIPSELFVRQFPSLPV